MNATTPKLSLPISSNHLFYGDNYVILRDHIPDDSIDLVYLDPPFNSQANYNVLFRAPSGEQSKAQIEACEDTWHWNQKAEEAFDLVMQSGNTDAADMLRAIRQFLKENDMMAYLTMMALRLIELHRVLKPTGSLYLHCDPTASQYLRILLDAIFGNTMWRNEIIWKRTSAHSSSKRFGPVHDVLFYYSKSDKYTWNQVYQPYDQTYIDAFYTHKDPNGRIWRRSDLTGAGVRHGETGLAWRGIDVTSKGRHWAYPPKQLDELDKQGRVHWPQKTGGMPMLKRYLDDQPGMPMQDVIADIPPMHNLAAERLGYPTQKPLTLLERLISASSNPGDVILDPFCGCGTTIHAAQKLGRRWVGIDITHLAVSLIEKRLKDAFPGIGYTVHGVPQDASGAAALAAADKHQFQLWAVSRVGAQPYKGGKKGPDGGVDGIIYFKPDGVKTERAIVSVKGGENVGLTMLKDLIATVDGEKAKVGVFVTLTKPTKPMITEATKCGFYEPPTTGPVQLNKVPKIQIITVEELFNGKMPNVPMVDQSVFKKAPKEQSEQGKLI